LVLMLFAGGMVLQYQKQQSAQQLAIQQQQLVTQQQEVELYQQALTQRQPSADLVKQYQTAERSVQQKQQLLSYLAVQQQQASQFYSPVLAHLQKIDMPTLWLTQFTLQQQQSSFDGITMRPDSVPLWLEDLRQLAYFRGQRFSQVNMQQVPDRKAVTFALVAQQGEQP
jgi:glutamate synthase domain-containing protein 2